MATNERGRASALPLFQGVVGVKFCGGCRATYDRGAACKKILGGIADIGEAVEAADGGKYDVLLTICGCPNKCVDISKIEYNNIVGNWRQNQESETIAAIKASGETKGEKMGWKAIYDERLTSAENAVQSIKSNDHVLLAHCVGEPKTVVDAMTANAAAYENVRVHHMVRLSGIDITEPTLAKNFTAQPMFAGANTRAALKEGRAHFIPMFFHEVPKLVREGRLPVDVLLLTVSPPDENGYCSLGTSVDYTLQGVKTAKTVIAQVNSRMPRTFGDGFVHVSEFTHIVEAEDELYEVAPPKITEVEEKIGEHCASLIEDGSTLQLGIGGIPDAVMKFLGGKKDLGIHSEMIADGTIDLFEQGAITGKLKSENKGKMTVTFLMGTRKLYDFAHNNPAIEVKPVDYVNHPAVIMRQHKMVSINSAIQVDLQGQVCAEAIGLNQFSGVGGQVDFIRGVAMGEDGKAIIAMPSVTIKKDGTTISKITPFLTEGAPITTSRNDIDYVITEYGIAELKAKTLKERAKNLIDIAHPEVRDGLISEYEKRFSDKF